MRSRSTGLYHAVAKHELFGGRGCGTLSAALKKEAAPMGGHRSRFWGHPAILEERRLDDFGQARPLFASFKWLVWKRHKRISSTFHGRP